MPNVPHDLDRALIRRALGDLRVAVDDVDAVAEDMLRPPRERDLGPVLHAANYRAARGKVTSTIAYLMSVIDGDAGPDGPPAH